MHIRTSDILPWSISKFNCHILSCLVDRDLRLNCALSFIVGVNSELDEDDEILSNGAQRAKQPRERVQQVLLVLRVSYQADAVSEVSAH